MLGHAPLRRLAIPLIGGLAAFTAAGCGTRTSEITVSDAFVPVPATADSASLYLKIANVGDLDDALVSVATPSAAQTHLHETSIDAEGRASMKAIGSLKIPAGETVDLGPGGLHLMMMQPEPLADGETVDVTLTFEHAGTKRVTAKVTDDISDVIGE